MATPQLRLLGTSPVPVYISRLHPIAPATRAFLAEFWKPKSFVDLPCEIRLLIYELVWHQRQQDCRRDLQYRAAPRLGDPEWVEQKYNRRKIAKIKYGASAPSPSLWHLCRCNKLLYAEVLPFLYKGIRFVIELNAFDPRWAYYNKYATLESLFAAYQLRFMTDLKLILPLRGAESVLRDIFNKIDWGRELNSLRIELIGPDNGKREDGLPGIHRLWNLVDFSSHVGINTYGISDLWRKELLEIEDTRILQRRLLEKTQREVEKEQEVKRYTGIA